MCLIRDRILLQVAPTPSTGNRWSPASTVQRPFVCQSFSQRQQVRPVTVWAEARQISSQAFRTLNAMANAGSHVGVRDLLRDLFPPALAVNNLGHKDIGETLGPRMIRPCAFTQHMAGCMVRKLRKCLYRGLSSVRTSAKAACEHSPRAN